MVDSELANWDVLFAGISEKRASELSLSDSGLGFDLMCQRRSRGDKGTSDALHVGSRQRVASRGIEKVGLARAEIGKAEKEFQVKYPEKKNIPDWMYRQLRKRPLLIVHLLAIGEEDTDLSRSLPHVAWSISFPTTSIEEGRVEYVVNSRWLFEQQGELDFDEDAGGDDE